MTSSCTVDRPTKMDNFHFSPETYDILSKMLDVNFDEADHDREQAVREDDEEEYLQVRGNVQDVWVELSHLKEENILCDVTLVVEGLKFPAHKAVLAAKSPYFKFLFTSGVLDTGKSEITMPNMSPNTLEILLDFMYCRSAAALTMKNVFMIFPLAGTFQISGLADYCCEYMQTQLNLTTCVGIMTFAETYGRQQLFDVARRYILDNFSAVSQLSRDFLEMNQEDLVDLISDDTIHTRSEEEVFEAVMRWINYKATERVPAISTFLRRIRLGLIQPEYFLDNISNHPYITDTPGTEEPMSRAWELIYHLESNGGNQEIDVNNTLVRPRIPKDVLFAIGGWSGGSPISFFETYDTRADRWCTHAALEDTTPRAYHGLVTLGGCVYVLGGYDGSVYYSSIRRFDPLKKLWEDVAPMYCKRCYVCAVAVQGNIYAIGGYDGRQRMKSVERYCPKSNQWTMVAEMNAKRSDAGADALGNKIYVAGGFSGDHCLRSAEVYDTDTDQWTTITPMTTRRSGMCLVAHQSFIFAMGGFSGERRMATGEKYCPETKRWVPLPEMYAPRSNFAAVVLDDMIFVIGGFNGSFTTPHVECLDPETGDWFDATDMNVNRSALRACVVKSLPNVKDYTFYGFSQSGSHSPNNANDNEDAVDE